MNKDLTNKEQHGIIAQAVGWLIVALVSAPAILTVAATLGLAYRVFLWAARLI